MVSICPVYNSSGNNRQDYNYLSVNSGEYGRYNTTGFYTINTLYTANSDVIIAKISLNDTYFAHKSGVENDRTPLLLYALMSNSPFTVKRIRKEGTSSFEYALFEMVSGLEIDGNFYNICPLQSSPVTTEYSNWTANTTGIYQLVEYDTIQDAIRDNNILPITQSYPITYHYTNSTVSGPLEAAVGDTVTVSAVPDTGYGITDASTQILVTNNDVAVPYTWDAANNRITFTMPDPS